MDEPEDPSGPLTTLVCVTCGAELFLDDNQAGRPRCPKCQGTVFRAYTTPVEPDEVTISHLEQEARSIQYGDPSPGTTPDDVRELDT
jgi:DNA-directed RNA polymerase subunit RPC12/RpoP